MDGARIWAKNPAAARASQTTSQMKLLLISWPIAFQVMLSVGMAPVRMNHAGHDQRRPADRGEGDHEPLGHVEHERPDREDRAEGDADDEREDALLAADEAPRPTRR